MNRKVLIIVTVAALGAALAANITWQAVDRRVTANITWDITRDAVPSDEYEDGAWGSQ